MKRKTKQTKKTLVIKQKLREQYSNYRKKHHRVFGFLFHQTDAHAHHRHPCLQFILKEIASPWLWLRIKYIHNFSLMSHVEHAHTYTHWNGHCMLSLLSALWFGALSSFLELEESLRLVRKKFSTNGFTAMIIKLKTCCINLKPPN